MAVIAAGVSLLAAVYARGQRDEARRANVDRLEAEIVGAFETIGTAQASSAEADDWLSRLDH